MKKLCFIASIFTLCSLLILSSCSQIGGPLPQSSSDHESQTDDYGSETTSNYPVKPIQLIVPYKAGGDTDIYARTVAACAQEYLGQPIVVVNVEGAGGTVATRQVHDADPDGYTVLFMQPNMLLNYINGLIEYSYEEFTGTAICVSTKTTVYAVRNDSPYTDLPSLIEDIKARPGEVKFATQVGGYTHLTSIALENAAGAKLKKLDVGGNVDQIAALLGGHVDVITLEYGISRDYFESGEMRALSNISNERSELLPDLPTAKEQGVDLGLGFEKCFFTTFPKGTPKEICEIFNEAVRRGLESESAKKDLAKLYATPYYLDGDDAISFLDNMMDYYRSMEEAMKSDKF